MKIDKVYEIETLEVPLNDDLKCELLEDVIGNQLSDFAFWDTASEGDYKPLNELKAEYKEINDLLTWAQAIKDEDVQAYYIKHLEQCKDEHETAIYNLDQDCYHEFIKNSLPKLPFTPKAYEDEDSSED